MESCDRACNVMLDVVLLLLTCKHTFWEKGPIGNWSHYVGFILELCSKYEIIS